MRNCPECLTEEELDTELAEEQSVPDKSSGESTEEPKEETPLGEVPVV